LVRASKKNIDGNLYINILDFKDEREQELMYERVLQAIKETNGRTRVY